MNTYKFENFTKGIKESLEAEASEEKNGGSVQYQPFAQ